MLLEGIGEPIQQLIPVRGVMGSIGGKGGQSLAAAEVIVVGVASPPEVASYNAQTRFRTMHTYPLRTRLPHEVHERCFAPLHQGLAAPLCTDLRFDLRAELGRLPGNARVVRPVSFDLRARMIPTLESGLMVSTDEHSDVA